MGGPYLAPGAAGTFYRITQHRSRNTCARFARRTRFVTISRVKTRQDGIVAASSGLAVRAVRRTGRLQSRKGSYAGSRWANH